MTLTGIVRGVKGVVVQKRSRRRHVGAARSVTTPGAFQFDVKPKVTTEYRLATANDAAASVRIRVAGGYLEIVKRLRLALLGAVVAALVGTSSSASAFTPDEHVLREAVVSRPGQRVRRVGRAADPLAPVKVAIVDSGVDCSLPDFTEPDRRRQKSFVGGSPCIDNEGHGTIVAGEIAGALDRPASSASRTRPSSLVAKVVAADGTIPLKAEAAGIRWAVNQGAQVVNLSFGAVRDPRGSQPRLVLEARGPGRGLRGAVREPSSSPRSETPTRRYTTPWPYASWPVRAAARDRGRRADPLRQRPRLLGPGSELRRHRRARASASSPPSRET